MWEFWKSRFKATPPRHSADNAPHRGRSRTVNFKDLSIRLHQQLDSVDDEATQRPMRKVVEKNKLIIIVVGLPGRGKTFLCNKLLSYLSWIGHDTLHFNVGRYRRLLNADAEIQNAAFFDHNNKVGMETRQKALQMAMDAMLKSLDEDACQVALFDATNSTEERRQFLISQFHGRYEYIFIESICNDEDVLEQNYKYKMLYSPDYIGVNSAEALKDFKARIQKYAAVYETITDRRLHYIKLIDMVTGHGSLDVNRISGYLGGKIVFFLMQICKAGSNQSRKIWLTRHGESEYNRMQLIGGDSHLSKRGNCYAQLLPQALYSRFAPLQEVEPTPIPQSALYADRQALDDEESLPLSVWTSTLKRTNQTAQYLPFPKLRWKALDEINAGRCDGMSYAEIAEIMPEEYKARKKDKLKYRYPFGESYLDVIQRLEPVIIEMEREQESICVVAHQAVIRAILTYFLRIPLEDCPTIEVPLHTILELTPMPDGTMSLERVPVAVPSQSDGPCDSPVLKFMDARSVRFGRINGRASEPGGRKATLSQSL